MLIADTRMQEGQGQGRQKSTASQPKTVQLQQTSQAMAKKKISFYSSMADQSEFPFTCIQPLKLCSFNFMHPILYLTELTSGVACFPS